MPIYIARCKNGTCSHKLIDPKDLDDSGEPDSLSGSVGEGGKNIDADVRNVQSRLNRVSADDGGPYQKLEVDGKCGPRTKAAIKHFQQRYWQELLGDGRIDVDQATWKKLLLFTGSSDSPVRGAKDGGSNGSSGADGTDDEATQQLFATYLFLSRWRVYEAIKALDEARTELEVVVAYQNLHPGTSFLSAYKHWDLKMLELPTVDRCFHIIDDKSEPTITFERIKRIRKVFSDMLQVITHNSITTPAAEKNGSRRFLRVTRQAVLDNAHPEKGKNGVIADAALGGWWFKNANMGRIRYGTHYVESTDALSTLIHEMAHYVSHHSTYTIGDEGGYYNKAFKAKQAVALRTAECYSWYALLASFKHLRSLSDDALPTDI